MSAALVQSVTGNGATLVLNSVVAGNALTMKDSYVRNVSTGVGEAVPTDTNGTWATGRADVPTFANPFDLGVGQFYLQNAASGTHTVTPQANSAHRTTLSEFSGLLTSGMLNDSNGGGSTGTGLSQSTGATSISSNAGDLVEIALGHGDTSTGFNPIGLTDPVSGFTTLQVKQDSTTDLAMMHAYQVLSAGGTQSATFNWTFSAASNFWEASIVTYKAAGGAPAGTSRGTRAIPPTQDPGAAPSAWLKSAQQPPAPPPSTPPPGAGIFVIP